MYIGGDLAVLAGVGSIRWRRGRKTARGPQLLKHTAISACRRSLCPYSGYLKPPHSLSHVQLIRPVRNFDAVFER